MLRHHQTKRGHINVYSELSRGSTFKIYLPQSEGRSNIPVPRQDATHLPGRTETILLVEDDPSLREMAVSLLTRLGYTVLTAADGLEALNLKQQRGVGHVDLVFTDVVMHHMSGKELSDRLRILYPQTKILFTSAYTENAMVHQGVLNPGVTLLQKPFTPRALACKVREVLDQPAAPKPDTARKAFAFTHKAPLRQPQSNTRHEKTDPESGIDDAYARGDAHRALFPQRIGRQDNYLSFGQRGPGLAAGEHRAGRHPALRLPLLAGRGTGSGSFLVHG